jgi:hypothetical protein
MEIDEQAQISLFSVDTLSRARLPHSPLLDTGGVGSDCAHHAVVLAPPSEGRGKAASCGESSAFFLSCNLSQKAKKEEAFGIRDSLAMMRRSVLGAHTPSSHSHPTCSRISSAARACPQTPPPNPPNTLFPILKTHIRVHFLYYATR